MTRVEKLKEIKELEFYASASKRDCTDMLKRVEWLKNNLDTKQSKEERQMNREYRSNKNSKTLNFNI